eukprot:scaffold23201_cov65-Phaeocystis_antarctica.AAC.5
MKPTHAARALPARRALNSRARAHRPCSAMCDSSCRMATSGSSSNQSSKIDPTWQYAASESAQYAVRRRARATPPLLPTPHSLFPTYYLLLTTHDSLPTTASIHESRSAPGASSSLVASQLSHAESVPHSRSSAPTAIHGSHSARRSTARRRAAAGRASSATSASCLSTW